MRLQSLVLAAAFAGLAHAAPVPSAAAAPASSAPVETSQADPGQEALAALEAALARDLQFRLDDDPFLADSVGDARGADRLPEVGVRAAALRAEHDRAMRDRVAAIPPDALSAADRLDRDLFLRLLERRIEDGRAGAWTRPLTARDGFHLELASLPHRTRFDRVLDYRKYIGRLRAYRRHVEQQIEAMREGIRRGTVPPREALAGWEDGVLPHVVDDPEASALWAPFAALPERFRPALQDFLRGLARDAIRESVVPAYRDLAEFLRDEYVPAAPEAAAAAAGSGAAEEYARRVRRAAGRAATAEALHRRAAGALAAARAALSALDAAGEDDLGSDVDALARWLKEADGALPRRFGRLPRTPWGLRVVDGPRAAAAPALALAPPAADGSRAGFLEAVPAKTAALGGARARLEAAREAVPGRHLQTALALENDALRPFRRHATFPAFVEGWAAYAAERAADDLPLPAAQQESARLRFRARIAAAAVADTGLHAFGWTRDAAIAFLVEETGEERVRAAATVDGMLGRPADALAAFAGADALRALRAEVEEARRGAFDVRAFHDAALGQGALPLDLLPGEVWRALGPLGSDAD